MDHSSGSSLSPQRQHGPENLYLDLDSSKYRLKLDHSTPLLIYDTKFNYFINVKSTISPLKNKKRVIKYSSKFELYPMNECFDIDDDIYNGVLFASAEFRVAQKGLGPYVGFGISSFFGGLTLAIGML